MFSEEKIVQYNEASDLRSLDFDEKTFAFFWTDTRQLVIEEDFGRHGGVHLQAPTYSQVFDWFEEKYNLTSYVKPISLLNKLDGYGFEITNFLKNWDEDVSYKNKHEAQIGCLRKLIDIVKK